ncbi:Beta-hexosaminidase subunit beta [Tetrabaena socialis]|uniref:beta-N-acetylhexosaminidase n=1 Tax=Tetrabaena socialis TaxID=47790 RepID=A0A2J7ZGY5_9CHLO|nr:Beta-hexosaminidase subunit beta [Tetrabaena socialis]|eukprot:PNG99528.1 Beta-hexosaminidase subunit beta [Tetrabaena socialis]
MRTVAAGDGAAGAQAGRQQQQQEGAGEGLQRPWAAAATVAAAGGGVERSVAEELAAVTAAGFRVIVSSGWCPGPAAGGAGDWRQPYGVEPLAFPGGAQRKDLVLGGEACLWSEAQDAAAGLLPSTWDRASAVAERLWSDAAARDEEVAAARLREHRCRMVARGIPLQQQPGAEDCPGGSAVEEQERA